MTELERRNSINDSINALSNFIKVLSDSGYGCLSYKAIDEAKEKILHLLKQL